MKEFLKWLVEVNSRVNGAVWGWGGLLLLVGTGIVLTVLTKFFQVSHLGHWWTTTIGSVFKKDSNATKKTDKNSISQFQALCTALAATIGTGNISGVAVAIASGGPGAVFWMWVAAFFGMMTNFSENVLGIFYRRKNKNGDWSGGPMYYLRDGLGAKRNCKTIGKILAVLFSVFTLFASFGIGNMGQVNNITENIESAFFPSVNATVGSVSVVALVIGIVIMLLGALIIIGGLQRIATVAERIVPAMAIIYVVGGLVIVSINIQKIPDVFAAIFQYAFGFKAVAGAAAGVAVKTAVSWGFKRGVFSNEAGLGSSVLVHSCSNVKEPVKQGMWGIFEVFFDTMIICTMTAFVVLSSSFVDLSTGVVNCKDANTLVAKAFGNVFGKGGEMFVAIAVLLFAFTTVLGWSQYGSKAAEYLFGTKAIKAYQIFFVLLIVSGAVMDAGLVIDLSDTFNGLMMLPNLIGVIVLCPVVMKITQNYVDRKIKNKDIKPLLSYDEEALKKEETATVE